MLRKKANQKGRQKIHAGTNNQKQVPIQIGLGI
jgi:hypothetical protein